MPHVFISYTNKNKAIAEQLCAVLERNGLRCWIAPRDIPPGYAWAETIVTAIGESQIMIAVISQDALRSEHMAHELEGADTNRVPILPIRLDATPLKGQFQYFLGNKQWLDLRDRSPDDYETDVVNAVRTLQARSSESPAAGQRPQPTLSPAQPGTAPRLAYRSRPGRGVHTIVDELREVIVTFVAVAMRREKALADFNLSDSRTLFFALRFLIYVSLASVILHIPAWSAQGIRFGHPAFMPSVLAEALIEQIALCFVLYAAIRLFRGTADPQQYFCAFCLLCAYQLMSDVCLIPVQVRAIAVQTPDIEQFVRRAAAMGDQVSIGDLAVLLVAGTASIGLRLIFLLALFRAFHITDQLGVARAAMSLVIGIAMWTVSLLVISQPFQANLYTAFRGP
jgi:hypothetical protein